MAKAFFDTYFAYIGDTETPSVFHRWSALSAVAATLGRRLSIPLGHYSIYPNMFTLLVGASGTRKTSAANTATSLLVEAGYDGFAPEKTSRDKFLLDLMEKNHQVSNLDSLDLLSIDGIMANDAETYIFSDDLQDFLGGANMDFVSLLGRLWETRESYEHRVRAGTSTRIINPVVNILGLTTPTGLGLTFPPEILGHGFMSKMLLVYGDITGKRIAFPEGGDKGLKKKLVNYFSVLLSRPACKLSIHPTARDLLTRIYKSNLSVPDPRFVAYDTRRQVHLLKLTLLCTLLRDPVAISPEATLLDVKQANTMLMAVEHQMPLALGEFGKGKFAEVGNNLMEALHRTNRPLSLLDLWKVVAQDLSSQNELVAIMRGLQSLDKVQTVTVEGQAKFLPVIKKAKALDEEMIVRDFLTEEEAVIGGIL